MYYDVMYHPHVCEEIFWQARTKTNNFQAYLPNRHMSIEVGQAITRVAVFSEEGIRFTANR